MSKTTNTTNPLTVEELIALGYSKEAAESIVKGATDEGGSSAPFPILKLNYDQKDVLIDLGIKKGNFIHGFKVDNNTLQVTEKGEDLGNTIEFFVAGRVYQNSQYKDGKTVVQTKLFDSAYDSKKQIDLKSGKTIGELKEAGNNDIVFNQILLLMVKLEGGYKPFIHYMHGANLAYFQKVMKEDFGVVNYVFQYNIKVQSKKIPTKFQPAWVFHPTSVEPRTQEDIIAAVKETSEAVKLWDEWIKSYNNSLADSGKGNGATACSKPEHKEQVAKSVEVDDIDEEDIEF